MPGSSTSAIHTLLPGVYALVGFGADPTGRDDSSAAVQLAMVQVAAAGGGIVVITPGTYRLESVLEFGDLAGVVFWRLPRVTITGPGALPVSTMDSHTDTITEFAAGVPVNPVGDGRLVFADALPDNPVSGDSIFFTAAATGLSNYFDTDGTTPLTAAAAGDMAQYDGDKWRKQTRLVLPHHITDGALDLTNPSNESTELAASRRAISAAFATFRALAINNGALNLGNPNAESDRVAPGRRVVAGALAGLRAQLAASATPDYPTLTAYHDAISGR